MAHIDDFTYHGRPGEDNLDFVRELIGDTEQDRALVSDSTINNFLGIHGNVYRAAAETCLVIAARFAREASSKSTGEYSEAQEQYDHYRSLHETLLKKPQAMSQTAAPSAPGIRRSTRDRLDQDTDIVQPAMRRSMWKDNDTRPEDDDLTRCP